MKFILITLIDSQLPNCFAEVYGNILIRNCSSQLMRNVLNPHGSPAILSIFASQPHFLRRPRAVDTYWLNVVTPLPNITKVLFNKITPLCTESHTHSETTFELVISQGANAVLAYSHRLPSQPRSSPRSSSFFLNVACFVRSTTVYFSVGDLYHNYYRCVCLKRRTVRT